MAQNKLDIFNNILAARDELAVTEREMLDHPLYAQYSIRLDDALDLICSDYHWFNTVRMEIAPDVFGHILKPDNVLTANPEPHSADLAFMNGVLVDLRTGNEKFTSPVHIKAAVRVNIQHLPTLVYQLLKVRSILDATGQFLSGSDVQLALKKEDELKRRISSEDFNQMDPNRLHDVEFDGRLTYLGRNV